MCDVLDLSNVVKGPTCFTRNADPTLNDVILRNTSHSCCNTTNSPSGLSDVHNLISRQIRGTLDKSNNESIFCRSFKRFDSEQFLDDLGRVPFHVAHVFDDIDDVYSIERLLTEVIDEHIIPLKMMLN
jgi:hypothetical protein